jgi:SulP family sulfate permease
MQHFVPKIPAALTAVIVSSLVVAWLSPSIDLVAKIPQGLPSFGLPTGIDSSLWGNLLAGGAIVALVGFSEGWGAEAKIAKKTHDRLDTNQEFIAYGVGNMGAGLLGGIPVTGSLSKSSAAEEAGAKSQMSNILLAGIVLLTLAFLAPALEEAIDYLPGGTYGVKLSPDGGTLYVNFNGHATDRIRPANMRPIGFGLCGFAAIHIPKSER